MTKPNAWWTQLNGQAFKHFGFSDAEKQSKKRVSFNE